MHNHSPAMGGYLTYERQQLLHSKEGDIFPDFRNGNVDGLSEYEIKFAEEWIVDYITTVFDESLYENIIKLTSYFIKSGVKKIM